MTKTYDVDVEKMAKEKFPDHSPERLAAVIAQAAKLGKAMPEGGGLAVFDVPQIGALLAVADRDVLEAEKLKGHSPFTEAQTEKMRDILDTFTKRGVKPVNDNPGERRNNFHKKYGEAAYQEAKKITGSTDDVRVAGRNPWKGNKAVKRALKGERDLPDTEFNRVFNADRIPLPPKPPKVKVKGGPMSMTELGALYKSDPAAARALAAANGLKI